MRFFIVVVGIAICQAACSTLDLNQRMASWMGNDFGEVVRAWGEPDGCTPAGQQMLCEWRLAPAARPGGPAVPPPTCSRLLAVAGDGAITGWRWRGNSCLRLGDLVAARPEPADRTTVLAARTGD